MGVFAGINNLWDSTASSGGSMTIPQIITALEALGYTITPTYQVTYNSSGADSGSVPIDLSRYAVGDSITVLDNTGNLVKEGFVFSGWTLVEI